MYKRVIFIPTSQTKLPLPFLSHLQPLFPLFFPQRASEDFKIMLDINSTVFVDEKNEDRKKGMGKIRISMFLA
jgi:hypothetical protein